MGDERLSALIDLAREMVAGRFGDIARELEDEIERRRLQAAYTITLSELLGYEVQVGCEHSAKHLWLLITATPEQRARAFLATIDMDSWRGRWAEQRMDEHDTSTVMPKQVLTDLE